MGRHAHPLKDVKAHRWESVARLRFGRLAGSQRLWTYTLECGHIVTRYDKSDGDPKPLTRARCIDCPRTDT